MSEQDSKQINRIPAAKAAEFDRVVYPSIQAGKLIDVVKASERPNPRNPRGRVPPKPQTESAPEAVEESVDKGFEKGFQEGREEGVAKGYAEGTDRGHAEGLQRGLEEGRAQLQAQTDAAVAQLQSIMAQLNDPIAAQEDALEAALLNVALHLAQALIGREIKVDRQLAIGAVRAAVKALPVGSKQIQIFVNPQDADTLQSLREVQRGEWLVEADASLTPGGCRVESAHSLVDYTLESRYRQLLEQMLDADAARIAQTPPLDIEPESESDGGL